MVDIDLVVRSLRSFGHKVGDVVHVPENAGIYELVVDGTVLDLAEARALIEQDEARAQAQ